jgi:IclR family acetate operon transcriptional repressor
MTSTAKSKPAQTYEVGVLVKTLDILDMLRNTPYGATLTEIAVALKLSKPTVYRIMYTLEARAFVQRGEGGRFRLTSKMNGPSAPQQTLERLLSGAEPVMDRLVQAHEETANMGILDGNEIVVVHAVESPRAIRMSSKVGNRRNVHSSALGKVLIAWKDPKEVARLLRVTGMPALTPRTITSPEKLAMELALVRERGYAQDQEENEPGGRCVAVPIRAQSGIVVAALSMSGPLGRMTPSTIRAILKDLRPAAAKIEEAL